MTRRAWGIIAFLGAIATFAGWWIGDQLERITEWER